jgi:TolA-binding protein
VTTEIDQQVTRREGAATITPSKDKEPEPAASDREVEEERAAAQKPTPTAAARPPRAKKPSAAPVPSTAPELFATANAHRRTGEYSAARVAYETLQAKFPGSSEALVSRVSLGRMLAGAAPALALAHFNAYLSQSQHTTLAAEALYGKARALSDLGNTTAEQQAWKQLLMRFPSSVYADQARAKLEQQE